MKHRLSALTPRPPSNRAHAFSLATVGSSASSSLTRVHRPLGLSAPPPRPVWVPDAPGWNIHATGYRTAPRTRAIAGAGRQLRFDNVGRGSCRCKRCHGGEKLHSPLFGSSQRSTLACRSTRPGLRLMAGRPWHAGYVCVCRMCRCRVGWLAWAALCVEGQTVLAWCGSQNRVKWLAATGSASLPAMSHCGARTARAPVQRQRALLCARVVSVAAVVWGRGCTSCPPPRWLVWLTHTRASVSVPCRVAGYSHRGGSVGGAGVNSASTSHTSATPNAQYGTSFVAPTPTMHATGSAGSLNAANAAESEDVIIDSSATNKAQVEQRKRHFCCTRAGSLYVVLWRAAAPRAGALACANTPVSRCVVCGGRHVCRVCASTAAGCLLLVGVVVSVMLWQLGTRPARAVAFSATRAAGA